MPWNITDDVAKFLSVAGDFVHSRTDLHTMLLSSLASMRNAPRPQGELFGWWEDGAVTAAFVWTPPFLLALSSLPDGAEEELAELVAADPRTAANLMTDERSARAFAAAWSQHTGLGTHTRLASRLFRLDALTPPGPKPRGRSRLATQADRPLLTDWYTAFTKEAGDMPADPTTFVDERLAYSGWTLWEVDGRPVSMAGITRSVSGMARITPVYTPPAERGQGYGAAVTAAVSAAAQSSGTPDVLLFTDVTNPVSNRLYTRIGFRPVDDFVMLALDDRTRA